MFDVPVSLDKPFDRETKELKPESLRDLLTLGLVYVDKATQLTCGKSTVVITWPPVFLLTLTDQTDCIPMLLASPEATRTPRNPADNEVDDLRVLACRYRLLAFKNPCLSLGSLLPPLRNVKHALHGFADVEIEGLEGQSFSLAMSSSKLVGKVQSYERLQDLLGSAWSFPQACVNADRASSADSFFIVKLRNSSVNLGSLMQVPRRERPSRTTATATGTATKSATTASAPLLVIFVSSKSHVVETTNEDIDAEVAKIVAILGANGRTSTSFAWLVLHITDATSYRLSDLYRPHVVVIGPEEYKTFAGLTMYNARRRFQRAHAKECSLHGTPLGASTRAPVVVR